ncbi:MAG: hypothetical protein AB7S97_05680, partial [Thermoplasmata archaeon]
FLKPRVDTSPMAARSPTGENDFTEDERRFLAGLRRTSGRTCRQCKWLSMRGQQRGCFPEGRYRKFLSAAEYDSGCELFAPRE